MTSTERSGGFYGYRIGVLHDRDGLLIGDVVQGFADTAEAVDDWEVQWLRVKLREPAGDEVLVPATGGRNVYDKAGRLVEERVAFTLDQVLSAPRCGVQGIHDAPTETEEAILYRHYLPSV